MLRTLLATGLVFGIAATTVLLVRPDSTAAQGARGRAKASAKKTSPNTKVLDVRAERAAESYMREAAELARDYEGAGDFEKARQLYENILTFAPDAPGLKDKIKQLTEQLLDSNEVEIEIDAGKSWDNSRVQVFKGKAIRIQADGTYNFSATAQLGPGGFPTEDPVKDDMAADIPCGALMGLMAAKDKPGKPFKIGNGRDFTPTEDGILFLKFNVPPGSRCSGKVTVRLSGYVRPL